MPIIKNVGTRPSKKTPETLSQKDRLLRRISEVHIEQAAPSELTPNPRNARIHSVTQIELIGANYLQFGMTNPIIVDENSVVLAGHARLAAAISLELPQVPIVRLSYLTAAEKRALALADNKLAEMAEWDIDLLIGELDVLFDADAELEFDPRIVGFETVEVDQFLTGIEPRTKPDPADRLEVPSEGPTVSKVGDIWLCGDHVIACGSALDYDYYFTLMGGERAQIVFTDPPYNVPNAGHVTKRAGVAEFAMAAGEMSRSEFTDFIRTTCSHIHQFVREGAVAYFCMDWRHIRELCDGARPFFGDPKNLIVWAKTNAGQGSFYRSQHELIFPFVVEGGSPINNFGLGAKGRYRSNVWRYPGVNSFGRFRDDALAMHPTVKPVALVMDALLDCSDRGGIVLDPFGGSGTTMIAAQKAGRFARLIEIDPGYCDCIVRRWERYTRGTAVLKATGQAFADIERLRADDAKART